MNPLLNPYAQHVILGTGQTGLACLKVLAQYNIPTTIVDTRKNPPNLATITAHYPHIPFEAGDDKGTLPPNAIQQADVILTSQGIDVKQHPILQKAIALGIPIFSDIELFAKITNSKNTVYITGSNGKSSVTTLSGHMVSQALPHQPVKVGGNLGTPAVDLLEKDHPDTDTYYLIELSSFQLEHTYSLEPKSAALLNITPDHLDRHKRFEDYAAIKHRIFSNAQWSIFNRQDPNTYPKNLEKPYISFGLDSPKPGQFGLSTVRAKTFLAFGQTTLVSIEDLPLNAPHQLANALAALAIGYTLGLPWACMIDTLKHFKGLPHRCQKIAAHRGIAWYNDSKATNIDSAIASIVGLGQTCQQPSLIVILGGKAKTDDFSPLIAPLKNYARLSIVMGTARHALHTSLKADINPTVVSTLEEAVIYAKHQAKTGDKILLAPACASFDQYRNFEERGEAFCKLVKQCHHDESI